MSLHHRSTGCTELNRNLETAGAGEVGAPQHIFPQGPLTSYSSHGMEDIDPMNPVHSEVCGDYILLHCISVEEEISEAQTTGQIKYIFAATTQV